MNQCPRCSYSLEGLPEHHVCPECGLAYHGDMVFVKLRSDNSLWRFFPFACWAITSIVFNAPLRQSNMRETFIWIWVLLIPVLIGILIYRSKTGRLGEFVFDQDGVKLSHAAKGGEYIPMTEIKRAKYSLWTGYLTLYGWDDLVLLSISQWELNGVKNAKNCVNQINRHVGACAVRSVRGESLWD